MSDALVYSVPGSGSRFTVEILSSAGVTYEFEHATGDFTRMARRLNRQGGRPVVMPIRDPILTYITILNMIFMGGDTTPGAFRIADAMAEFARFSQDPMAYVFKVDEDNTGERRRIIGEMENHLSCTIPPFTWATRPDWSTADHTGLRTTYLAGQNNARLDTIRADISAVASFYRTFGYTV